MYIRGPQKDAQSSPPLVIPAGAARRMAKLQRETIGYALAELNDVGQPKIDGIYASTALGNLEDTEKFLDEITGSSTSLRSPLPFMRSTHNTIAGQLALSLKIHGPNITYSQDQFGFHTALLNAVLHCEEEPENTVMIITADEVTDLTKSIMRKLSADEYLQLGDGWECFVVGHKPRPNDKARITLIEQGSASATERWNHIVSGSNAEHIYWSAYPEDAKMPAFPAGVATEQYDHETGHHGAQTGQALAMVSMRLQNKAIEGPCLIIDRFGDTIGVIGVERC